jgi:hypothetical protein
MDMYGQDVISTPGRTFMPWPGATSNENTILEAGRGIHIQNLFWLPERSLVARLARDDSQYG